MLTAISADQLQYEIASGDLSVLPIDLGETRRSIGITQRQGAGTRALVDEIRAQVERMIKEGQLSCRWLVISLKNRPPSCRGMTDHHLTVLGASGQRDDNQFRHHIK
jgi:hypothetical protein